MGLTIKKQQYLETFYSNNNIEIDYIKYDSRLKNLEFKIDKWLNAIPVDHQEVFLFLLSNLKYMSRLMVEELIRDHYSYFKVIEPNYIDTIFIPVSSLGGIYNGAINIVECLEEALSEETEISKKNIPIDPRAYYETFDLDTVKNIVFIDDVIGSGDTFTDFLFRISSELPKLISDKKLYLLSLFNLKKGIENIEKLNERDWDITILNPSLEDNIFDNQKIYSDKVIKETHKSIIKKYEKQLVKDKSEEINCMGYKKSSILLSLFYNTPNNTLSTFWKESEDWFPIFPRKEDKHIYELKNKELLKEIKQSKKINLKRTEFIKMQIEKERKKKGISNG